MQCAVLKSGQNEVRLAPLETDSRSNERYGCVNSTAGNWSGRFVEGGGRLREGGGIILPPAILLGVRFP